VCLGSVEARKAQTSAAVRESWAAKRKDATFKKDMARQQTLQYQMKKKDGRPVTNPEGFQSKTRVHDATRPERGGRYARTVEKAPATLGTNVPVWAKYSRRADGTLELDAERSTFRYKLPTGKSMDQIAAHLSQLAYSNYSLDNFEEALVAASDVPAFAPARGAAPPTRSDICMGASMEHCYVELSLSHCKELQYAYVVADERGNDANEIVVRLLEQIDPAEYTPYGGEEPFAGYVLDDAPIAFTLSTRTMRVPDDPATIGECGQLFVYDCTGDKNLFYGIVNRDKLEEYEAQLARSAQAAAAIVHARRAKIDLVAAAVPLVAQVRQKVQAARDVGGARSGMLQVVLTKNGERWTPMFCRHGKRGDNPCQFSMRFSRKGGKVKNKEAGGSPLSDPPDDPNKVVHEYKVIDHRSAIQFRVRHRYCLKHKQWESDTDHTTIGRDGIALSEDIVFPGNSKIGVTAAGLDFVDREFRRSGNASSVRRALFSTWGEQLQHDLAALIPSLTFEERRLVKDLIVPQLVVQMQQDLPDIGWLKIAFQALHKVRRRPQIERLMLSLAVIAGDKVDLDFGHTVSGCITTNSTPGAEQQQLDPAEQSRGEPHIAERRDVARQVTRTTYEATTLVVIGQGRIPIMPAMVCGGPESHEQAEKNFFTWFLRERVARLGPFLAAPAIVSTDKMAADERWIRDMLKAAAPLAFAEFGEHAVSVQQDSPHEKNSQTTKLPKSAPNYAAASFAIGGVISDLLGPPGVPTKHDLAVAGCGATLVEMTELVDSMRHSMLDPKLGLVAKRLSCSTLELEAVYLQRVLLTESLQEVDPSMAAFFQKVIDNDLIEGLAWQYLMDIPRYEEIVMRAVGALGLGSDDCVLATGYHDHRPGEYNKAAMEKFDTKLICGVAKPPRSVLANFVRSCGRDAEVVCPQRAPIDALRFIGGLAGASAWYKNIWPSSATADGMDEVHEVARISGIVARQQPCQKTLQPVTADDVTGLIGRSGGGGITDNPKHEKQIQKLTAPKKQPMPVRMLCLVEASRSAFSSSHGTVAAEQANFAKVHERSWAGIKTREGSQCYLDCDWIDTLFSILARWKKALTPPGERREQDAKLAVLFDSLERDLTTIVEQQQSYATYYTDLKAYRPEHATAESLLAEGFTAHAKGPASDDEKQAMKEAIAQLMKDPSVVDGKSVWLWVADRVKTRRAGWVHAFMKAEIAKDSRARDALAEHFVSAPVEFDDESDFETPETMVDQFEMDGMLEELHSTQETAGVDQALAGWSPAAVNAMLAHDIEGIGSAVAQPAMVPMALAFTVILTANCIVYSISESPYKILQGGARITLASMPRCTLHGRWIRPSWLGGLLPPSMRCSHTTLKALAVPSPSLQWCLWPWSLPSFSQQLVYIPLVSPPTKFYKVVPG
jgi:hypothetical protein